MAVAKNILQQDIRSLIGLTPKISAKQKLTFFRVLTTLVQSGIPILKSLELVRTKVTNEMLLDIVQSLRKDIHDGSTLSKGLRKYPGIFTESEIGLLEAGEKTGTIERSLVRITENLEKYIELSGKVTSTLLYPFIILGLLAVVLCIIIFYVLPTLSGIFENQGTALPLGLRLATDGVAIIQSYWYIFILGIIAIVWGCAQYFKEREHKKWLQYTLLKIPFYGHVVRKNTLIMMSLTFSTLLEAGLPLMEGLSLLERAQKLIPYQDTLTEMKRKIIDGNSVSSSIPDDLVLFPADFKELIAIGENTASMQDMFKKIAKQYTFELEIDLKNMTTLIEPLSLLFVAILIGFFAFTVLGSIFDLIGTIS